MRRYIYTRKNILRWEPELSIYRSQSLGLISVPILNEHLELDHWVTIADKNLGATEPRGHGEITVANSGNCFQWGNNYAFPSIYTQAPSDITDPEELEEWWYNLYHTTDTTIDTTGYGPTNPYSSNIYRVHVDGTSDMDWSVPSNDNLWGGVTDTLVARKGPCANGFHIPSIGERQEIISIAQNKAPYYGLDGITDILLLPRAGGTANHEGTPPLKPAYYNQGTDGYYWSSDADENGKAYRLRVKESETPGRTTGSYTSSGRNYGFYIRPFRNSPVIPDETWIDMVDHGE